MEHISPFLIWKHKAGEVH